MQLFVKLEEAKHCQPLNYDGNRAMLKTLAKEHQDFVNYEWMWTYQATSRTVYRGCWFMDFLQKVFELLTTDREGKLNKLAGDAY